MNGKPVHPLVSAILSPSQESRSGVLEQICSGASYHELLQALSALHEFERDSAANTYQRVRAQFQISSIYRYWLPRQGELPQRGHIPASARTLLLACRYQEAIALVRGEWSEHGASEALSSTLAAAYYGLGFQTLADQVQRSVRSLRGNRWMFRVGHTLDYPLRIRPQLLANEPDGLYPVLVEDTPVRLDLCHSGWSDIFFLGMDFPEGARVLNISVDLAVAGHNLPPSPPIRCFLRVIDRPIVRLVSVDLKESAEFTEINEIFDFARDHLGLLKAALVASGIVPPGLEGCNQRLESLLHVLLGPNRGIELVSQVNGIPKGSRLAVSTNLLGSLIALCMRATGQLTTMTGAPSDAERRLVAGRAILGEWLGGSGGGWQDSGGLWPGIKTIVGAVASSDDVEFGSSRGRLLPTHAVLNTKDIARSARDSLQASLVVVHGGLAANVGPILEMVTERFLLASNADWAARQELIETFDKVLDALKRGQIQRLGGLTTRAFEGPLRTIIPWVTNAYTERLIAGIRQRYGEKFWGFCMLGGMSGGGMGFLFEPTIRDEAEVELVEMMRVEKLRLESCLPFAMTPIAYRVAINEGGTIASLRLGAEAVLSTEYYMLMLPKSLTSGRTSTAPRWRKEINAFTARDLHGDNAIRLCRELIERLLPASANANNGRDERLRDLLDSNGLDPEQHELFRTELLSGAIGLSKNLLPVDMITEDACASDVTPIEGVAEEATELGERALRSGEVALITLAGGVGSRWTQGAGTVKALHPFASFGGKFRSFVDVHLAKTRRSARRFVYQPTHVFSTSYLTHHAIETGLAGEGDWDLRESVLLSPSRSIGLRLVPTVRDLLFAWQHQGQQKLEARKEKVRESARQGLLDWVKTCGEASDYVDNVAAQCVHPLGHWYEVANLFLNGTILELKRRQPQLKYLMLHNLDTLGADLDPRWLGQHILTRNDLTFEVMQRRFEDSGGGLARVAGRLRLVEGLAFASELDEGKLTYYNSLTTWISVDALLRIFGMDWSTLSDLDATRTRVRAMAARVPTYVTLKEVKRRWGRGHEDVLPVVQFEKLWGDMSSLDAVQVGYFDVPRFRGQQLKDVAHLDVWSRDGSKEYVAGLCDFGR